MIFGKAMARLIEEKQLTISQLPSTCLSSIFKSLMLLLLSLSLYPLAQIFIPISVISGFFTISAGMFFRLLLWHSMIASIMIRTRIAEEAPPDIITISGNDSKIFRLVLISLFAPLGYGFGEIIVRLSIVLDRRCKKLF